MRNNILKALSLILAVTLVAASCLTCVFADDTLGSITVTLEYNNTAMTSGTLTLYQVATINPNGTYSYADAFVGYSTDDAIVDSLEDSNSPWLLWKWATTVGAAGTSYEIGSDGTVTFTDLAAGVYLIVPTTLPTYFDMEPSLVSVPDIYTGEYDITVNAKLEYTPPTVPDEPTPTTTTVVTEPDVVVTTEGTNTEEGKTDEEVDIEEDEPEEKDEDTLPQTGQLNYPIPIMAGAGVFCVAAGLIVVRTDKKK
ncbi:MAG: hypothetical protein LUH56_05420 [Oscillospiraceae bacterium]|nr:hypothetical protein [Oscillospiraceae bacterium]